VVQDTVEAEPHPVEDTEAERVGEAAPWPQADVDAATREAPLVLGRGGVRGVLEPDDVQFWLMERDGDIPRLDVEFADDEGLDVPSSSVSRKMQCPRNKGARFLVACVACDAVGVGDEDCFLLRAFMWVTHCHGRGWWWWRRRRRRRGRGRWWRRCTELPALRGPALGRAVPRPAVAEAANRVTAGSCPVVPRQAFEAASFSGPVEGPSRGGGWPP
jgi:hypothetical protein